MHASESSIPYPETINNALHEANENKFGKFFIWTSLKRFLRMVHIDLMCDELKVDLIEKFGSCKRFGYHVW